ncbi:ricin-type beta-trefoil lectin domain protein [Actinoplanes sp. NPDC023714]|uniref:ricin-type beta-trefoil lectin domain protein n=1 Tax=Actinoplanes sp. NPDC023714 TaxID=3154322 RepID=UPI0033F56384
MRRPRVLRGLLTATATAALVTLLSGPALAAPAPVPTVPASPTQAPATVSASKAKVAAPAAVQAESAAAAEDDGLPTDEAQKVRAAREIGIEPGEDWLSQSDRNFVFKIWQNSASFPLIRTAAELALSASNDTIETVCKEFILQGIFEAKIADDTKKIADEAAARQARDLKRAAYAAARITVDADGEMLILPERDVIYEIWKRAAGARVKAAALAAFEGDAAAQREFLTNGVKTAAEQDVQDEIQIIIDRDKELAAKLAREGRMTAAAAVLGILADAGKLAMTDDNYVRWIWEQVETDPRRIEIRAAAEKTIRSSDPAVWWNFIDKEIHAANGRDRDRLLAERAAADRQAVLSLRTKAGVDGKDNLVTAATHALMRNADGISDFLLLGQYQVAPDTANRPNGGKPWQWTNLNSGKCLATQDDAVTNGKLLVQADCADSNRQRWVATRTYNTTATYRLINAWDRTKCVSLASNTAANNIMFVVRTCDNAADQDFSYTKVGDNFIWVNKLVNRAITVQNASKVAGAPTLTFDVNNGANQQFYANNNQLFAGAELSEAKVLQHPVGFGLRLQTDGNVVVSKGPKAIWSTKTTTGVRLANQLDGNLVLYRADGAPVWTSNTYGKGPSTLKMQADGHLVLYRNSDNAVTWRSGIYDRTIVSSLHGKCITVPNGNYEQGVQLEVWTCNGSPSQGFIFNDNFLSLNGKCIDVNGGSSANGTKIQLWNCSTSAAQVWHYYTDDTIRNPATGKCIDIPNGNKADGVKLALYTCGTGANQKWR